MFQRREIRQLESNTKKCTLTEEATLGTRVKGGNLHEHQLLNLMQPKTKTTTDEEFSKNEETNSSSCKVNSPSKSSCNNVKSQRLKLKLTLNRIVIGLATIRLTSTTTSTSTAATVTTSTTYVSLISTLIKSFLISFYYILAFTSLLMLILYINRNLHTSVSHCLQNGNDIWNSIKKFDSIVQFKDRFDDMQEKDDHNITARKKHMELVQVYHQSNQYLSRSKRSSETNPAKPNDYMDLKNNTGNNVNLELRPTESERELQQSKVMSGTKTLAKNYAQKAQTTFVSSNVNNHNSPIINHDNTHSLQDSSQKQYSSLTENIIQKDDYSLKSSSSNDPVTTHKLTVLPSKPNTNVKTSPDQVNKFLSVNQDAQGTAVLNAKKQASPAMTPLSELTFIDHATSTHSLNNKPTLNNYSTTTVNTEQGLLELQSSSVDLQWIPILKPLQLLANIPAQSAQQAKLPSVMISNPILTQHVKPTNINNIHQLRPPLYFNPKPTNNNIQARVKVVATNVPLLTSSIQNNHLLPAASYQSFTRPEHLSTKVYKTMNPLTVQRHNHHPYQPKHYHQHLHEHHHIHLKQDGLNRAPISLTYRQMPTHQWRQPRLNSHYEAHGGRGLPRFTKMYKRILLCDKTLVSLDYVRNPSHPPPMGPHIPYNHPIDQPHYDIDGDSEGDNIIDLGTELNPVVSNLPHMPNTNSSDNSLEVNTKPLSFNEKSSLEVKPADERSDETVLQFEKRSYLSDDDPLVKCDMWDLEKGLKNRKPPKEILQMAIKADFDTVRDAINRCRQLTEKTLPPDDDAFRDGLDIMSTEDLMSLFSMKRGLIPGTKWCGLGDQASSYNDLGSKHRIDICCRAHDHCPIRLKPFRNDYGVLNIALYTKSHCDCDADFYRCLREAHSRTADMLGNLYFNVMKLQCMREERMKICRQMKPIALGFERCVRYEESPSKRVFKFTTPPVAY